MRQASNTIAGDINSSSTTPGYLVQLTYKDGTEQRFSSRGALPWNGLQWPYFAWISRIENQAGGVMSATVTLDSDDVLSVLDANDMGVVNVSIWGGAGGDYMLVFQGSSSNINIQAGSVTMDCTNWSHRRPVTISAPLVEYITPPGTIIDWGGRRVIIEGER